MPEKQKRAVPVARGKQMVMALYSAALGLGLVLSSPWWLVRMTTTRRYREGLRERLGAVPARLEHVSGKRVVWLHAVSVGETLAATRLVGELQQALGSGWEIVISTTTRTGQALARERFGAERVFYFPFDFACAMRRYLKQLRPTVVILMESELWPRLLHECANKHVAVVVVNARVSDRSFARAKRVRVIWKHVLRMVSVWLAQGEEDGLRLKAMGVHPSSVRVTGNLKYDVRAPGKSKLIELLRGIAGARKILVAGSTLGEDPSESSVLIQAQRAIPVNERPLLILAPRHPEDFDKVYVIAMEYNTVRATELLAGKHAVHAPLAPDDCSLPIEIVVLDTIGDLASIYSLADVTFVGGSLVKRGGHNPLEPAQFGVPVVMGPSFENFRDIVNQMREAEAISVVEVMPPGADTVKQRTVLSKFVGPELAEATCVAIHRLLQNPSAARVMGEHGRRVFETQQGATTRAVGAIVELIHQQGEEAGK